MHELSITQSILEIALRHAGDRRVTDIHLVIGRLASIVDDSVQFYWDMISEGSHAEGARLHFKRLPAILRCDSCAEDFEMPAGDLCCPTCAGSAVQIVSGRQFSVEAIEVGEPL